MKSDTKGITKVSGRARGGGRGDAAAGQAGTGPSPTTAPAQQQADERVSTPVSARVLVLSLHHIDRSLSHAAPAILRARLSVLRIKSLSPT